MNAKHTPGPWEPIEGARGMWRVVEPVTGTAVARLYDDINDEEAIAAQEADARLIAAAPDLAAACVAALEYVGIEHEESPLGELLRAALQKAGLR